MYNYEPRESAVNRTNYEEFTPTSFEMGPLWDSDAMEELETAWLATVDEADASAVTYDVWENPPSE